MNTLHQLLILQKEIDTCEKIQNDMVVASWRKEGNTQEESEKFDRAGETIEANRAKMRELIMASETINILNHAQAS